MFTIRGDLILCIYCPTKTCRESAGKIEVNLREEDDDCVICRSRCLSCPFLRTTCADHLSRAGRRIENLRRRSKGSLEENYKQFEVTFFP